MVTAAVVAAQQQMQRGPTMDVPRLVLDAIDGLVVKDDKKRTQAGMVILQHVDQTLKGKVQGKELPDGVKYILQRLVSGLASTRLSAREGFFSTLCLLLRHYSSSFKPAFILSLLTWKKSATMKSITKDEIRDQVVAELLLCGALVRSGQVKREPEVLQHVVNQLCAMRTKKSYMEITATQFLVNLMEGCQGNSMHEEVWQSLQAELQEPVVELSPSQLWLRLVLLRKHRKKPPVWLTSTLTPNNFEALGQAVMKAVIHLPEVHPVLPELISDLATSSSSHMVKFWSVILESLKGHSYPGKLQILFHLLRFILPHLRRVTEFKAVVTSTVVGLLLSSLSQPVSDLKEAARGVTAAFIQLVMDNQDEDSGLQLALVQALVSPPGSIRFDQLAGHKVLGMMIPNLTLTTLKGTVNILLEVLQKPKISKDSVVAERNYAAHTLSNLLGQPRACTEEAAKWRLKQLANLLKIALLTPIKDEEREGDTAKDAFFKALGKMAGHIKEYKDILLSLVEEVEKELTALEAGTDTGSSPSPLKEEEKKHWSRVYSRLALLRNKEYKEGSKEDVAKTIFQVLYCQMALHLFVNAKVAIETIEEFITCHKEVKKLGILNRDKEEDEEEEEEGDVEEKPSWVEVVTEMLLSLMTQEMQFFRQVVQGLFWMLTPHMTALALSLLTDVLDSEKARELLKKEGEEESDGDEEEGEEAEEDEDDDEDEERKKEGSDDDGSISDAEEEAGGDDDDDANLFTLKKKMLHAAGGIEVDVDMDSVPQEELDHLDEKLGALLAEYRGKQKRKGKGGGGDGPQLTQDEQSLMHFQTRVCDMLIVYIKAAPNMALQVGLVIPILKALHTADLDARQKDLQNKLVNVISALKKKKKFNTIGNITTDSWKKTVNEFFSYACQMPAKFGSVIQSCYSQLMHCGRVLLGQAKGVAMKPDNFLTVIYVSHLETFFKNHQLQKVQPFTEPCTYNIGGLWQVAATLVHAAFDADIKIHKQGQALMTLEQLYTNKALVAERTEAKAATVEQDLYIKIKETLDSMQSSVNGQYAAVVFRLLKCLLQVDMRTEPEPYHDWGAMRDCVEAFRKRFSKTELKSFRREYSVFYEALKRLLSKTRQNQGVKRVAEEMSKDGSQEAPVKKRKEGRINRNSIGNPNTSLNGAEDKKKKKKKKNQVPSEEILNQNSINEKIEGSNEDVEVMVINGDDKEIQFLGEINIEEIKVKKKKKKEKLANSLATIEESSITPDQEEIPEKKKKKKEKLTDIATVPSISKNDGSQKEDNEGEERTEGSKKKKKKEKLSDAVIILSDSNSDSEIQISKNEERIEAVALIKKKKKKDKLQVKRKQKDESQVKIANEVGEQGVQSSSICTVEPPLKKKKKKHSIHQNAIL